MRRFFTLTLSLAVGVAAVSCSDSDSIDAPEPGASADASVDAAIRCELSFGAAPLRRLSHFEYDNTVRDLLGVSTTPASKFVDVTREGTFDNEIGNLPVSAMLLEQYTDAAISLATEATKKDAAGLAAFLGCDASGASEDACIDRFVRDFGKRAFRRPLASDEVQSLRGTYAKGRKDADVPTGVRRLLERMLVAPQFLYHVELGEPAAKGVSRVKLTSFEIASRLSYLFWGTMPDAQLFAAAEGGHLSTTADIEREARRLLRGDDGAPNRRAQVIVDRFFSQWLGLPRLEVLAASPATYKDPTVFSGFNADLAHAMRTETERFTEHVFWDRADVGELFGAHYAFVNHDLSLVYGLEGVIGSEFRRVELPPEKRSGLLTQASLMTLLAGAAQTSPIKRGVFVLDRFLCQPPMPLPGGIDNAPPKIVPGLTTRERFAALTASPACRSCHASIDSVGFSLENFDGIGRYRDTEEGKPIDATAHIEVTGPLAGDVKNGVEFGTRMAASDDARQCVGRWWFRFAHGRVPDGSDRCALDALSKRFAASGYRMEELLVAITQTPDFLYRAPQTPTP